MWPSEGKGGSISALLEKEGVFLKKLLFVCLLSLTLPFTSDSLVTVLQVSAKMVFEVFHTARTVDANDLCLVPVYTCRCRKHLSQTPHLPPGRNVHSTTVRQTVAAEQQTTYIQYPRRAHLFPITSWC